MNFNKSLGVYLINKKIREKNTTEKYAIWNKLCSNNE